MTTLIIITAIYLLFWLLHSAKLGQFRTKKQKKYLTTKQNEQKINQQRANN